MTAGQACPRSGWPLSHPLAVADPQVIEAITAQHGIEVDHWRFSKMTRRAGIGHWHAHEGRHTAVSIMSSNGVKLQDLSDTMGHKSTHVIETVYRHVIVPAIRGGASVMDAVFGDEPENDEGEDDAAAMP